MRRLRELLVINFYESGRPRENHVVIEGVEFRLQEHCIGLSFSTAVSLIQKYDGHVDGIVLRGIRTHLSYGGVSILYPPAQKLLSLATKSNVYIGSDLHDTFSNWTLSRLLRQDRNFFRGSQILFHSVGLFMPCESILKESGARVLAADPLTLVGIPKVLRGSRQMKFFMKTIKPFVEREIFVGHPSFRSEFKDFIEKKLSAWIEKCDIYVVYSHFLAKMTHLNSLRGKIVITDYLSCEMRRKLELAGVVRIIELVPDLSELAGAEPSSAILTALIDQLRLAQDSPLSPFDFALQFIAKRNIRPAIEPVNSSRARRCAFVIHPLSIKQLAQFPGLKWTRNLNTTMASLVEGTLSKAPSFLAGTLTGPKSISTGQEVVCDIYVLPSTPKELLKMREDVLYKKLGAVAQEAHARGAVLLGLGAYTKVAGDRGVTVARQAPIPVTTGNSYSASATLWAARVMVEKMGFTKSRAMIIGGTGSIGRASALLLSKTFDEIILVAQQIDKLIEVKEEILELSPNVEVKIRTQPNEDLPYMDLIVTATSNITGKILDIHKVKPGAVICDCSRPLDISPEEASLRPDVLVVESGEIDLPGDIEISMDIGLPKPSVYACLAETVLLTMEGRYESFSLSRHLSVERASEIYEIGLKHGAKLSAINGPLGFITDLEIEKCRNLAEKNLSAWVAKYQQERNFALFQGTRR